MADVQALFEQFHENIRTYEEINGTLREKKDIIVDRVKKHLADNGRPTCHVFLQGSYKMKVGICALAGAEYDIDVGLRFDIHESEYTPAQVRRWVFDAVNGHTQSIEEKGPCIRVAYVDGYHVDLVAYARWEDTFAGTQYRLAHKTSGWRPADPPGLVHHVKQARRNFAETKDTATSTDQFRRVVRYLKRWNDNAIRGESDEKPSGLALVLLTEQHLPSAVRTWEGLPDDRAAVEQVARAAAYTYGRISAIKPTPEGEDVFGRLSETGMTALKSRFGLLSDALAAAARASSVREACEELRKDSAFGSTFPCPPAGDADRQTAMKTRAPAIISSSSSGA